MARMKSNVAITVHDLPQQTLRQQKTKRNLHDTYRSSALRVRSGHKHGCSCERFVSMPRPIYQARCRWRCFRQGIECCDTSMCEAATVGLGRRNPPQSGPRSISPQRRAATPSEVALNERNALTSTPGRQKCRPLAMRASQKRLAREIGEGRRAEFHSHMNHAVGSWAHVLEGFHWLTTFVVSRAIDSLANLSVP